MIEIQEQVLLAILKKAEQSARGGWSGDTIVLVDASRLGASWLPAASTWTGRLSQMDLPWSDLPFAGVGVLFSNLAHNGLEGGLVLRPDLMAESYGVVEGLITAFGFVPPSGRPGAG
jgi:hypothetical protein